MQSAKKILVGGNWKSNGTMTFLKDHIDKVINPLKYDQNKVQIVIAPIFIHLMEACKLVSKNIEVSAQNISPFKEGAFTGEITAAQVKDLGINWTIIGHSERRNYFKESDELVATKVELAQINKLKVILCIGEKLEEREANQTWEVCKRQLDAVLPKIKDWNDIAIAYEPVWAIGTGKNATPEQAQEVHLLIRNWMKEKVSESIANSTRIMYGGSVNEKNCADLIKQKDIDGFLVGGASINQQFITIVKACNEVTK